MDGQNVNSLVFLDLETSGLNPQKNKIIEVAMICRRPGEERFVLQQLVNPGEALDPFITQLTGISDEMLRSAPAIGQLRDQVLPRLEDSWLVAHNANFDVTFLEAEFAVKLSRRQVVDTIELAKILYPRLKSYSLRSLVRTFDLKASPCHRALGDAEALEALFVHLAGKARRLDRSLLERILQALAQEEQGLYYLFLQIYLGRELLWPEALTETGLQEEEGGFGEDPLAFWNQAPEEETARKSAAAEAAAFWRSPGLSGLLEPGGPFSRQKENYQYRPQQTEMLRAVMKAFQQSRFLMVEAPTGVGKSLAYLLPALTWSVARQERVVIATHTIYLQEQLYKKEIPEAAKLLPFPFHCAVLKGRGNYLCLNRWLAVLNQGTNLIWGERVLLARLAVWLEEGTEGDLDSIHLLGPERDWFAQMASSRETCQGTQCPHYKECYYQKARYAAGKSDLLIINHALMLADACLGDALLSKYQYLIIDEAHHLEEEGTRQFTREFSLMEYEKQLQQLHKRRDVFGRPGFIQYLKDYRQKGIGAVEKLEPLLNELEKQLKLVMRRVNLLQEILKSTSLPEYYRLRPGSPQGSAVEGVLSALDNLRVMGTELSGILVKLSQALQGEDGRQFEETWLKSQLQLFGRVLEMTELLDLFLKETASSMVAGSAAAAAASDPAVPVAAAPVPFSTAPPLTAAEQAAEQDNAAPAAASVSAALPSAAGEQVYWFRRETRTNDIILCITPLNTASFFRKYLFEEKESVVMTSATLSVGESFSYFSGQLGVDQELTDTAVLCSPFDYAKQVLLMTDKSLPDPARTSETAYNLALADSLEEFLKACGGRSMVLFTSHKQLRAMYEAIAAKLKAEGLELFADGINGSRSTLMEELKTNPRAVVFGANTFWEGVDLPGLSLTSLLIVRLPFAPPGMPMTEARIEQMSRRGEDPFYEYSLPQAVLRFKQGYGRLIRTSEDWGVVVILDNRIVNKRYGRLFLQSLPDAACLSGKPAELVRKIAQWQERFSDPAGEFRDL